jgi:ATP citrate (pro-S)-lyase
VPESFEGFSALIGHTFEELKTAGKIEPQVEVDPPEIPENYGNAYRQGRVRRATGIVSTICDDRGEEPTYGTTPISDFVTGGAGVGDVIAMLWFKRKLPMYATRFIELVLMLAADHGPCVSGAHNTIVCARAGKDLVSCVASGLLTIGPRFGGAIDDAVRKGDRTQL